MTKELMTEVYITEEERRFLHSAMMQITIQGTIEQAEQTIALVKSLRIKLESKGRDIVNAPETS